MPTFRRLFFRCADTEDSNLTVDILMNDQRHWVTRVPACGWWGRIGSKNLWPFILITSSQLDFGSYFDEETGEATSDHERYADIDIDERILAVGEQFQLTYYGSMYLLQLERIIDVTEL